MQVFGDIYIRNCFGAIVGNYFNQKSRIKCEFYELRGMRNQEKSTMFPSLLPLLLSGSSHLHISLCTISPSHPLVLGLVIVMNPQDHEHHLLDGIALTALHLKFDVIIYVAPGNLSLLQCVQVCTSPLTLYLLICLT